MTEIEAQKLVATLINAFPTTMSRLTQPQQERTQAIYRRMLLDLESRQAAAAVQRLLATSRYLPSVAEVRAAVLESERGQARPAGDAWGDVLREIHACGVYGSPEFDDANVARAVRGLDWVELCTSENTIADRARFIELYERLISAERRELQMPEVVRRELPIAQPARGVLTAGAAIANLLPAIPADDTMRQLLELINTEGIEAATAHLDSVCEKAKTV